MFSNVVLGLLKNTEQANVAEKLDASFKRLKVMLDQLLELARLETGALKPVLTSFEALALVDESVAAHSNAAGAKGLIIRSAASGVSTAVVKTDRTMLVRILNNLLSNAIAYTASGEVTLRCERRVNAVAFIISDTGVGIAPDQQEEVFKGFYKPPPGSLAKRNGLGLGLYAVRQLIDLLGLEFSLKSEPGRGTDVSVLVPLDLTAL